MTRRWYNKLYYRRNKRKILENTKRYRRSRLAYYNRRTKHYNRKLKLDVFQAYGNRCYCCKESNLGFLTIDHMKNNGYRDKKRFRTPTEFYAYLQKANYPKNHYKLACFNCNCGRQWNEGICPHKRLLKFSHY